MIPPDHRLRPHRPGTWRSPLAIGILALIPITVLFLLGGPFAHVGGILLWLVVILGPLTHVLLGRRSRNPTGKAEDQALVEQAAPGSTTAQRPVEPSQTTI